MIEYKNYVLQMNATQPATIQNGNITRIYINIPIVINSDQTLPISVTVGGQHITINETGVATDSSLTIKLKDYQKAPNRETNRHRSNLNKEIYAQNQNDL